MFAYPVDIAKDANGSYCVSFPDIPEALTVGATKSEALDHAVDALETALSFYVEDSKALPKISARRGRPLVAPTIKSVLKLGIYQAMKQQKIRKADLARRLKCHAMQIDRLLDLCHASRLEQLEQALAALGQRVHLEMEEA